MSIGLATRLWTKVEKTETCWLWRGATNGVGRPGVGHGQISVTVGPYRKKRVYAHRLAWELAYGPVPEGMCVLHRCDIPNCVNPEHLFLGTPADNVRDCITKGRKPKFSPTSLPLYCINGHFKSAANVSVKTDGSRTCRICHRERERNRQQRIRQQQEIA